MKIWQLYNVTNEHFSLILQEQSESNYDYLRDKIDGKPLNEEWNPLEVVLYDKSNKYTDFPIFWDVQAPIFSEKAVNYSLELLGEKVEFLPLKHDVYNYFVCNVINIIDCLNESESKIKRFSSGRIMDIIGYDFNVNILEAEDPIIFKIPQELHTKCFVTETFKNHIESSNLKGYVFREIWDSDNSWLLKEQIMQDMVRSINSLDGERLKYNEAVKKAKEGHKLVSSQYAIQVKDEFIIYGKLQLNGTYQWIDSPYYPPIFHDISWVICNDIK